jgi:hypothetical protein
MRDDAETIHAEPGESIYKFFDRMVGYAQRQCKVVNAIHNETSVRVHPSSYTEDLREIWHLKRILALALAERGLK